MVPEPRESPARALSEAERARLRETFALIDSNNNGAISRAELIRALREHGEVRGLLQLPGVLGQEQDRSGFEAWFQGADLNGDHAVTWREFEQHMSGGSTHQPSTLPLCNGREQEQEEEEEEEEEGCEARPQRSGSAMALFGEMDLDGNGVLDLEELRLGLGDLGFEDSAVECLLMQVQLDGDGMVHDQAFDSLYLSTLQPLARQHTEPHQEHQQAPSQPELLVLAASRGEDAQLQQLLAQGVPVDCVGADGRTALMAAARGGHHSTVQALLRAQACVDQELAGRTALCEAVAQGQHLLVPALVAARADPNLCTSTGWVPLAVAAQLRGPAASATAIALLRAGACIRSCRRLARRGGRGPGLGAFLAELERAPRGFVPPLRMARHSPARVPAFAAPKGRSRSRVHERHLALHLRV